ncbi:hypothetical protein ABBQ38_013448 [Trebouxia sp. C0009 RCD-2024]
MMKRSKATPKGAAGLALDVNEALKFKQKLDNGQAPSRQELLHVLQADKACDSACKGRKDNPNCLHGLVPAVGSVRRKGLWQKEPQGLMHLGVDPAGLRRQDSNLPCGLNNLGNTCYVNSALQCLFMTTIFRNAMYQVAPPAADDNILGHIRRLFAELQAGIRYSADPKAFAQALNLDHTIQQDGQEFLKLLLSLLESKLGASGQPAVQSLVPDLYRGSYAYETICKECGQRSQGSNRDTHFYELDIQVKGSAALDSSLADMLSAEELSGDNQYHCDFCGKKADATRQLCLRQLPPYLCLSLQRFVFDMKKLMKVKATDKFSFPLSIDLGPYQAPHSKQQGAAASQVYDLQAILIHKGSSASQGHYVAHVLEGSTDKWWRFDDETVTAMPEGPIGEKADHGVAASSSGPSGKKTEKAKGKAKGKSRKRKASGKSEEEFEDESTPEPMQGLIDQPGVISDTALPTSPSPQSSSCDITSSNAYMLMYKRRSWQSPQGSPLAVVPIPESLRGYIKEENQRFDAACSEFQSTQQKVREAVKEQQNTVRNILQLAPVPQDEPDCRFVSADWLAKWADSDPELTSIDNSSLQCPHGKLLPNKPAEMKRISYIAWEELQQRCGGGPDLGPTDVCAVCLLDMLDAMACADEQGQATQTALALAEALDEQEVSTAAACEGYYVSKTWLQGWKKRQGRSMSSCSPTEGISCPHGALLPAALGPRTKRVAVPPLLWDYFKESWQRAERQHQQQQAEASEAATAADSADGEDVVMLDGLQQQQPDSNGVAARAQSSSPEPARSLHEFPARTSCECEACLNELSASTANGQVLASEAEQERMQSPHLAAGTPLYLEAGTTYTLMPRPWLQSWRAYVNGASKRGRPSGAALPPHPPSLKEACQALLCTCHFGNDAKLAYPLPSLAHRRGKWMQGDADSSMFEVVATADWLQLLSRHAAEQEDSIRQIETALLPLILENNTARVEGAMPDEKVIGDNVLETLQPAHATARHAACLDSNPEVCHDAIEQQEADAMAARLVYTDAEVMVELVAQADFKPSMLNLTGDRKSKRARKGRAPIKVSADDKVRDLKLKIVQTLNVHPENALIHVFREGHWQVLGDDIDARLAEHGILPDEEIVVVNTHIYDDDDLGSFFGQTSSSKPQEERGFTGTALSSHGATAIVGLE